MGIESASFVDGLVITNPVGATDERRFGDDHLRLIKSVLKNTFPNADKSFYFPRIGAKASDYTILPADRSTIFTSTGSPTVFTLPTTLTIGDAAWWAGFIKPTGDASWIIVRSPSGGPSVNGIAPGGAALNFRRSIPWTLIFAVWLGSSWSLSRASGAPIGGLLTGPGAPWVTSVPIGYLAANGGTYDSTQFPDLFRVYNTTTLPNVPTDWVVAE